MQEKLYKTVDAEVSLSDSECRTLSIRQRLQGSLYRISDARIYQTTNAGPFLGDNGCRRHSIIIVNAGLSLSDSYAGPSLTDSGCWRNFPDSGCSSFSIRQEMQDSIRQRMQETLYQTGDVGISPSLRQQMLYSLYWTADVRNTLSGSGCRRHSIR